jgi:hypothetical protein
MQYVREILRKPAYAGLSVLFALLYAGLSMLLVLYVHESLSSFYANMYASYTIAFTIFTILLSVLFGISMALIIAKFREVRLKSAGLGLTGVLFGSLAAGCPGCFFGLFPFVLSFFGISATLAILPYNGIELQVVAALALCFSIVTLGKETEIVCRIEPRARKK